MAYNPVDVLAGRVNEEGKFTKLTPEIVQKLEDVFAMDGTVEEAAFYAGISKQTYYNWIKEHPQMKERFDALREKPVLKARQTIIKSLETPEGARWYMERKKKKEFALKSEVELSGEVKGVVVLPPTNDE